ncbi:hypothetical protein [Flavobacterium sp. J372]|uniref:hypothetical protein n=1 Tax=Flavobacterium sp. J372 TaxID=2898436 RepID=UPI0027E37BCA|nr:hypothetical protein [Flavobacterium sp. J372]
MFLFQGIFITILGLVFGLILGTIIILLQQHYSLIMITNTLAYPVEFTFTNVLIVIATILVLGILASRIAAGRVNERLLENS